MTQRQWEPAADYANYTDAEIHFAVEPQIGIRVIRVICGWFPVLVPESNAFARLTLEDVINA